MDDENNGHLLPMRWKEVENQHSFEDSRKRQRATLIESLASPADLKKEGKLTTGFFYQLKLLTLRSM